MTAKRSVTPTGRNTTGEDFEKAQRLQEDIEMLHDPPEALKEDVADLVGEDDYDAAQAKLERL